jgi:hypothetical protein
MPRIKWNNLDMDAETLKKLVAQIRYELPGETAGQDDSRAAAAWVLFQVRGLLHRYHTRVEAQNAEKAAQDEANTVTPTLPPTPAA